MVVLAFDPPGVAALARLPRHVPVVALSGARVEDRAQVVIDEEAGAFALTTHLLASMSRVYGGFALAAIFALPIGILIAFMAMRALGLGSNIMSLGGIAIAIGAMIDAAIVMLN